MSTKTLNRIQYETVCLAGLLHALRLAMPCDAAGSDVESKLLVGWAADIADKLANDIDEFGLTLTSKAKGGVHE